MIWRRPSVRRQVAEPYRDVKIDAVAGIDARGFIFGTAVAIELGMPLGFIPVRYSKAGKLPFATPEMALCPGRDLYPCGPL